MTPLKKLPKNVGDLGKLIVAQGFKKLPKVQKSPNLVTLRTSLTLRSNPQAGFPSNKSIKRVAVVVQLAEWSLLTL